ncbi:MAG: OmpA family protein [Roseibacillus sp.]
MKILIILATAMLVPIMMKFQAQTILAQSNPKTAQKVSEVLKERNVIEPIVSISYLEATIAGSVTSEAEAEAVVAEVGRIRGVSSVKNELIVQGWMTVERVGGALLVKGVVPSHWKSELLKGQSTADTNHLDWRDSIQLAGKSAVAWGLFIDDFLRPEGDRSLNLSGNRLLVSGEVTPSQLSSLRKKSMALGTTINFESEMKAWPSPFHFDSRVLTSPIEGEPLRSLSQKLADSTLVFESQSSNFTPEGRATAHRLLAQILQSPPEVTFVLGGHPDQFGDGLGQQRAEKVKVFLTENGVPAVRLEAVPFEMTEDRGGLGGQVELLVR